MPWDFLLIFVVLAVFLPWRGMQRLKRFLSGPALGSRDRIGLYLSTVIFQWLLAAAIGWRAMARGLTLRELGLAGMGAIGTWTGALAGAALFGGLHWMNLRRMGRQTSAERSATIALTRNILPQSLQELLPYLLLAITAGLCEEFIYRGFTMAALFRAELPSWSLVLCSAALFGLAHLYQGRGGLVGTLVLGAVFAAARIAYDSLIPVMMWHVAIDVVAGLAGRRYLLKGSGEVSEP